MATAKTFLQLCRDTRRECGISGTGPSAVTNQTGEMDRVVNWVVQSWTEIQNRHTNWKWMRAPFTLTTSAGDGSYTYADCTDTRASATISRFGRWWWEDRDFPWRIYLQSAGVAGERYLISLPWENFRDLYDRGTQNNGQPAHVSVDPYDNIRIGPKPDGTYIVSGDYQRSAQTLSADSDEPDMPAQFHDLIVYKAMMKHGGFESAQEVWARGNSEGGVLMRQLEANQLPRFKLAGPLA